MRAAGESLYRCEAKNDGAQWYKKPYYWLHGGYMSN